MPLDHPALAVAADAMSAVFGRKPFPVWTGGTVPVAEQFQSVMGIWCLYFAFSEPDNGPHAPNEFYRVSMLRQGTEATVRLLAGLARRSDAFQRAA
jgi:acetylornithine deacetylase/succinyl-diaminopimelate desuccinylase-like protein